MRCRTINCVTYNLCKYCGGTGHYYFEDGTQVQCRECRGAGCTAYTAGDVMCLYTDTTNTEDKTTEDKTTEDKIVKLEAKILGLEQRINVLEFWIFESFGVISTAF